jgi:hypothetical protein
VPFNCHFEGVANPASALKVERKMRKPYIIAPIILLALAAMSYSAEAILYGGRLNDNNVLQESFFLPLTFILITLAIVSFIGFGAAQLFKK